jgi:hypothetical protein
MREAVRSRASCNVFYLPLVTKIDFFVLKRGPFDASEFARKKSVRVRDEETLVVKSAEDRVSGPTIDNAYLDEWAPRLGLTEHVERARHAATL